mmetsp:Transcript_142537/g.355272  ORF Transcript_142537/g.355272 Transcript_142537/m.355272 type:complete len:328 (+) Transcript_142537:87-1070(+)
MRHLAKPTLLGIALGSVYAVLLVAATCRLPVQFPETAGPSGVTIGPRNSLIVASDQGSILFVDMDDYAVREDTALNDKYRDAYGWFDLEGITMNNPETSSYLYLGMENKPAILEYDWKSSHEIVRRFDLPGLGTEGVQSLAWVPTQASSHMGYFYAGSRAQGSILVYELPLLENTGPEAQAVLRNTWTPLKDTSTKNVAGLAYSDGYIFVSYDDASSNHVLIYPIMANGLYGDLAEQYQVDVVDAQGMAVQKRANQTWEVYFASDSERSLLAYTFRFVTGFELHGHCTSFGQAGNLPHSASSTAACLSYVTGSVTLLALSILSRSAK